MATIKGIVIGLLAGFYDVQTSQGIIRSRARGVFRQKNQKPCVGDWVKVVVNSQGINYLVEVLPRKNRLGRPAVANVSHVLLVISAAQPEFSVSLLDRFLTYFAWQHVAVGVYLSKRDLCSPEQQQKINQSLKAYHIIGYPIFNGATQIKEALKQTPSQIWTLAGQSGVGKSTLLNQLKDNANQKTGSVSGHLSHGKQTTRQVQLFAVNSAFIADTPGFSAIDLTSIRLKVLSTCFLEFQTFAVQCRFRGCQHLQEPGCAVKAAVKTGDIMPSRYESYKIQRLEIENGRLPEYRK